MRDGSTRTLPCLGTGSAGIALVATEPAAHAPDAESVARLPHLLRACISELVVHPGLVQGRAGLLATLATAHHRHPEPGIEHAISRHLRTLGLHAVPYGTGTAFPGHRLLRPSMDLATGSAGVLPAIATAVNHGAALPFIDTTESADDGFDFRGNDGDDPEQHSSLSLLICV